MIIFSEFNCFDNFFFFNWFILNRIDDSLLLFCRWLLGGLFLILLSLLRLLLLSDWDVDGLELLHQRFHFLFRVVNRVIQRQRCGSGG